MYVRGSVGVEVLLHIVLLIRLSAILVKYELKALAIVFKSLVGWLLIEMDGITFGVLCLFVVVLTIFQIVLVLLCELEIIWSKYFFLAATMVEDNIEQYFL